jgi:hypothetical protein
MRFANTFVSVKRPSCLVTERNDARTSAFAHHIRFAQLDVYVLGFQPGKLSPAYTSYRGTG